MHPLLRGTLGHTAPLVQVYNWAALSQALGQLGLTKARHRHKLVAGWAPSPVYILYLCNILYIPGVGQPPVP